MKFLFRFLNFKKEILILGHFFIAFRGREKERRRERNTNMKEKHQLEASHSCPDWGLYMSEPGIESAT